MTKERLLDTPIKLGAFKDGVADGLLEGHRSDYHPDMYSYKQGYDFGLAMYNRLTENENNIDINQFIEYDDEDDTRIYFKKTEFDEVARECLQSDNPEYEIEEV